MQITVELLSIILGARKSGQGLWLDRGMHDLKQFDFLPLTLVSIGQLLQSDLYVDVLRGESEGQ